MLTLEDIRRSDDLKRESVDVPEWGGTVYVRELTGRDKDRFDEAVYANTKAGEVIRGVRVLLVCLSVCDDQGVRLFADTDLEWLADKSGAIIERLYEAASRLNGLGAEAFEDTKKNSGSDPNDAPGSDSPSTSA